MSITLQNLTKSFGDTYVVNDLSLKIESGEFVVLLGPSGCGKTTTLRMIAGLEQPTSGEMLIQGGRVNDLPPQKRDIAMVFQSYALYPHMTVRENIAYPLRVRKRATPEIHEQVSQTAALLEIQSLLDRLPRQLSGGERQRVALARAIVRHPRAFLMDEPLSNLDARLRLQMRGELKHLQQQLATTTLYVTHDQAEAMTLGHRVAVMSQGKLQQFETPLEIYNRPANRFVAEFVGSPGMNFIDGKVDLAARAFVTDGVTMHLEERALTLLTERTASLVTLGLRPEDVRVSLMPGEASIPAKVFVTELMGSETLVIVELPRQRLVARAAADFRAGSGINVWINFNATKAHFFDQQSGQRIDFSEARPAATA
jgi:multiple sugar transport system ATP-binding protein